MDVRHRTPEGIDLQSIAFGYFATFADFYGKVGSLRGIRTLVTAMKKQCPNP